MRLLRWSGGVLLGLVVLVTAVGIVARFGDGPIGPFPGGPLESGEYAPAEQLERWIAATPRRAELQLLEPPRSRTVAVLVREGRAYVPCVLGLPPFKRWHLEAERDGRAVVRAEGTRYPVQLARVLDEALERELREAFPAGQGRGADEVWFFRLEPRAL